jgi:hypothetical protein
LSGAAALSVTPLRVQEITYSLLSGVDAALSPTSLNSGPTSFFDLAYARSPASASALFFALT